MLISLIVPCYNEEEAMPLFYKEASRVAAEMKASHGAEFEFIFVDDGSRDGTLRVARALHAQDPRVRYVSFSRNFGKEAGIYAGLQAAKGDYVATMDADLQDPPALLPQMLDTLLTAKTLYCQQHGINLTCVADGTLLHFLTTGEICTIVGTVLDNATESVLTEPDPEKRLIRAAIYAQNGFVMLRFENYCADPVELGPDGLPARSSHGGYDLKSVRAVAEAHGGTLTLHWENEWFTVRILLPQK